MGLFGSKNNDEINVKAMSGKIKSICARSFMGGSDFEDCLEGDTFTVSALNSLSAQLKEALGYSFSVFGAAAACVSVTRYGSITVELFTDKDEAKNKQPAFPSIASALEGKGYTVFYSNQRDEGSSASISISKDGVTKDELQTVLPAMLNDVAIYAVRVLQRY